MAVAAVVTVVNSAAVEDGRVRIEYGVPNREAATTSVVAVVDGTSVLGAVGDKRREGDAWAGGGPIATTVAANPTISTGFAPKRRTSRST